MLSAEELEAEYFRRFAGQQAEKARRKFQPPDPRDADLEKVWVVYVWEPDKNDPEAGKWLLAGFRRKRNRRKVTTMNRFFSKVRRKLNIDKKSPVMLYDLQTALRQSHAKDQSWRTRPPQFQRRIKRKMNTKHFTPVIDRTKRKRRATQKAFIFNLKKTKYIVLGRNVLDKRKPGYLYLGPLRSENKRLAQFEAKRLFPIWTERLIVPVSELSKPLRAALARNRRVRAGVTRIEWPEVPPPFDAMYAKFVDRLIRTEFVGLESDDPAFLDTRDELHTMWQEQGSPWLTMSWFFKQIKSWSNPCAPKERRASQRKTRKTTPAKPSRRSGTSRKKSATRSARRASTNRTKTGMRRVKLAKVRRIKVTVKRVQTRRVTLTRTSGRR